MMGESDWFSDGDTSTDAIANAAEIAEEPAEDIRCILEEWHYDHEMAKMGEENPFVWDACYVEKEADDFEYWDNWLRFENILKTEARFFSASTAETLSDIFEGLSEVSGSDGTPIIIEAGPGTAMTSVYRSRVFQAEVDLEAALERPDLHMGPPPASMAKAGRMNAHGISVFYGATNPRVAISEVRPPVGSQVMVGEFALLRNLNLLDLNALQSVFIEGSVFDSEYLRRLERAKFLKGVSRHMSRPVMPDDQPLEYLVTQSVSDYLASRSTPVLDGIAYPSIQHGIHGSNVMLFHKASRVALRDLPNGTEIEAWTGYQDDEGWETDYTVVETLPPPEGQRQEQDVKSILSFWEPFSSSRFHRDGYDSRKTTLQLKLESLEVLT